MITFDKMTVQEDDGLGTVTAEFSFNNPEGKPFSITRKMSSGVFYSKSDNYSLRANYASAVRGMVYTAVKFYRGRKCPDTLISPTVENDIYLAIMEYWKKNEK